MTFSSRRHLPAGVSEGCKVRIMTRGRAFALLFLMLILLPAPVAAGEERDEHGLIWRDGIGPYVEVSFVLVRSTTSYADALRFAKRASADLGIPLDLRGLTYDSQYGLTWPREECDKDPLYPFPCYVARGRYDSGRYLSIERSDAYGSLKPGLFIVIAASGDPSEMRCAAASIRAHIPDAYLKTEQVYFGCMH